MNIKQVLFVTATFNSNKASQIFYAMKKFNQSRRKLSQNGMRSFKHSFLGERLKFHHKAVIIAIFGFVVLHIASQFILFQNKESQKELTATITEHKETKDIKPEFSEYKATNESIVSAPISSPTISPKQKIAAPRVVIKKKEPSRETRAERLRRAEKILTGV